MLGAQKNQLIAHLQVRGLNLRQAELDFYMTRFVMTSGLSSIMTALAYVGIIKIKIPEDMIPPAFSWQVTWFYIAACVTMALSMFNLVVTSFCIVYAQGLSLRGPPGSVAKSVRIFRHEWRTVRWVLLLSLGSLMLAALSIIWMKLDGEEFHFPIPSVLITTIVVSIGVAMLRQIYKLQKMFAISEDVIVRGDLTIQGGKTERIDLVSAEGAGDDVEQR
mmetsp:Transcript_29062/g.62510  ORF Transcript_29062/g.62510 Transcript_29062/m.62510 type:complete len:219 (-) Transcript_29062:154-810(-)